MAPIRRADFEMNRIPETATAASFASAYVFYGYFSYYYAYAAMLEVRSSGD